MKILPLRYTNDHLEPYISERTVEFHYWKHLVGYIEAVNKESPPGKTILELIRDNLPESRLYRNASQVFNHYFYFDQLNPRGQGQPLSKMGALIEGCFGSLDSFKSSMVKAGIEVFGSGWVYLTLGPDGDLHLRSYTGTGTPLTETPLIALDVWEHAYYLDYQNDRKRYIENFLGIIDWGVVENRVLCNLYYEK